MDLGHMVLCTHGFQLMVLHVMEPIKGFEEFIVMKAWMWAVKAHLAGLARVLAKANEISLGWVFTEVWGFSQLNIRVYDFLLVMFNYSSR